MSDAGVTVFWFRRDLRLDDNHGLFEALRSGRPVLPLFIFDRYILDRLEDRDDRRVSFLHDEVSRLQNELKAFGSTLLVEHGLPEEIVLERVMKRWNVVAVLANHDHEPYARQRDDRIGGHLKNRGIDFRTFKDQSIFERDEVLKEDGRSYTVFTPYKRKWLERLKHHGMRHFASGSLTNGFLRTPASRIPTIEELGFKRAPYQVADRRPSVEVLANYARDRDLPAAEGTTGIGVHLRFGTVSVRRMAALALAHSDAWLSELIWREFFMQILWHFPHVEHAAFRPAYDRIPWRNNEQDFRAWCEGRTGYPLVDAGMRQLRATGTMHNRVRMVVASFLAKHLLIDWRWGEAWFARWLMDFELSSNNGNWQWAAGSGCDAAPYFRVFNPGTQLERFDPRMEYVLRWCEGYGKVPHPQPIVDHAIARARAIEVYSRALGRKAG